jgi:sortase A
MLSKPSTPATDSEVTPASEPPDRLLIPAIDLDSPIVPVGWNAISENGIDYSVWEVADEVVGWHRTSAYPGHADNVVLNGHHNIRGEVFRYLVDLEIGDHVLMYAGQQVYHYAVSEKHILKEKGESAEVRKQNAAWIAPTGDERMTMVTCWPYTNNTHRLVVVARPIPPPQVDNLER